MLFKLKTFSILLLQWMIDWLIDCEVLSRLIDCEMFGRLIDWLWDVWSIDWLIDWLTAHFVAFWHVVWLIVYLLDWELPCDFQCPRIFWISFWTQKVTHLTDHSSPVNEYDAWLAGPGVWWRGSVWSASGQWISQQGGAQGRICKHKPPQATHRRVNGPIQKWAALGWTRFSTKPRRPSAPPHHRYASHRTMHPFKV